MIDVRRRGRALRGAAAAGLLTLSVVPGPAATPARAAPTTQTLLAARLISDLAYADPVPADTQGNLLDLYLPERPAGKAVPLFIFSDGSAWEADTGKSTAGGWAARLNPLGYAVAGVSVRSSDQVVFPGQLHDFKAAIRYLRANADTYDLAADRFAAAGFSSGGWAAALAGVTNDVGVDLEGTEGVTGVSSRVQAVVTFAAPTALKLMDDQATPFSEVVHSDSGSPESAMTGCTQYDDGIGDPACTDADRADPRQYVSADDPPYLIFHTSRDQIVPFGQSQVLFDALAAACVSAEYHYVEGPAHVYDPYLANPGRPPVTGQTLQKARPGRCDTTQSSILTDANTPSYALVAAFLDRTIGPLRSTSGDPVATTTTVKATPSRQVFRAARGRVRLTAAVSPARFSAGGTVRFVDVRRGRPDRLLRATRVSQAGRATVRLPRTTPVGRHRVRAVFVGTARALGSRSEPVRIRVVRRR